MKHIQHRTLILTLILFGVTACGGDNTSDLHAFISQVKAKKAGKIDPIPKPQSTPPYIYKDFELRDPFTPVIRVVQKQGPTTPQGEGPDPHEPYVLEQYPLNSLKMVGSLEKNGTRWALIKTQDGSLMRTKKNEYMGQDYGKIVRITESDMELQETVSDGLGGWIKRQATLTVAE